MRSQLWACLIYSTIVYLGFLPSLYKASSCAKFGNNLVQTSQSRFNRHGTFANVDTFLSCSGNATKWNLCFYVATTDRSSITYLGIYRLSSSTTYSLIPGSSTTYNYTASQTTSPYICTSLSIPQSQQYIVNPGDVLVACVPRFYKLGIIGSTTTEAVLRNSAACSSLPTDPVDVTPSGGYFTQAMDLTMHVGLEVNECAVNNGGCAHICSDHPVSYSCTCFSGYRLDVNSQSCIDINECFITNGNCSQVCSNTIGSYYCTCFLGFQLTSDNMNCTAIEPKLISTAEIAAAIVSIFVGIVFIILLTTMTIYLCIRQNYKKQAAAENRLQIASGTGTNENDVTSVHHIYEETLSAPSGDRQRDRDFFTMDTNKAYRIATGPNAAYNVRNKET